MIDPTLLGGAGLGGGVGLGLIVYTLRSLASVSKELDEYKVKVAEQYVSKAAMGELEARIDKRFDKLEQLIREEGHR